MQLTTNTAAAEIEKQCGVLFPEWRMRRVFDSLAASKKLTVTRIGNGTRTIRASRLPIVINELRRMGLLAAAS